MCENLIIKIDIEPKCDLTVQKLTFDDGRFSSEIVQNPVDGFFIFRYIVYENRRILINKYTGNIAEGMMKNENKEGDFPYIFVQRLVEISVFKGIDVGKLRLMALEFIDNYKN